MNPCIIILTITVHIFRLKARYTAPLANLFAFANHLFFLLGCNMINTEKNFTACHSVVPPDQYYKACLHESCLCSKGGDCACFCSAVASYVRACNQHGVSILWRREGFCGKCSANVK